MLGSSLIISETESPVETTGDPFVLKVFFKRPGPYLLAAANAAAIAGSLTLFSLVVSCGTITPGSTGINISSSFVSARAKVAGNTEARVAPIATLQPLLIFILSKLLFIFFLKAELVFNLFFISNNDSVSSGTSKEYLYFS